MAYMYILRCGDGSYYVGSARDIETRMEQHAAGRGAKYTSNRLPVTLVFCAEFNDIGEAYALEKQVQGWSRRKREALIEGRYGLLPQLSDRKSPTNRAPACRRT